MGTNLYFSGAETLCTLAGAAHDLQVLGNHLSRFNTKALLDIVFYDCKTAIQILNHCSIIFDRPLMLTAGVAPNFFQTSGVQRAYLSHTMDESTMGEGHGLQRHL